MKTKRLLRTEINDLLSENELSTNELKEILNIIESKISKSITVKQPISRGCCPECGEGYDNEDEWKYNTGCALCGYPIPENKIIKRI